MFGKKKDKPCDHIFEDKFALVIQDKPRIVGICKRCGLAIHRKIYTVKQVQELENGN
jgi:hypothetical protein